MRSTRIYTYARKWFCFTLARQYFDSVARDSEDKKYNNVTIFREQSYNILKYST